MSSLKNDLNEKQYWRSLSDLADTEEFQSYVSKEFADVQVGEEGSVSRRRFMQLMGASLTLAGTPGCWWEGSRFLEEGKDPSTRSPAARLGSWNDQAVCHCHGNGRRSTAPSH